MEHRTFEKLGVSPSLLGFGCMRFPKKQDETIDEAEAEKMIDKAMAAGVTYIDTAYPYHNGESEPFVGRVLKKYDRNSFFLATKLPVWLVEKKEDAGKFLQEQLERLDVEYVDFYLMHAMDKERWEKMKELGIPEELEKFKKEGKIRYLGFSFHDDYEVFEEILTSRKWDFCQIQYNYMNRNIQAGDKGYALTEKLGVPLVIMEPIKGGSLAQLPEEVCAPFKAARPDTSISSWALRWIASRPNVHVVLSGMSTMEQVEDNLKTFQNFEPLSEEEEKLVEEVSDAIRARTNNGCTGCAYCMPCPNGVNIPRNFRIWNDYAMYGNKESTKWNYNDLGESAQADQCVGCGQCEEVCPQKLSIREDLEKVAAQIGKL